MSDSVNVAVRAPRRSIRLKMTDTDRIIFDLEKSAGRLNDTQIKMLRALSAADLALVAELASNANVVGYRARTADQNYIDEMAARLKKKRPK